MIYYGKRFRKSKGRLLNHGKIGIYRWVILTVGTHPCAYIGIPPESRLYLYEDYDELSKIVSVHGGFTFMREIIPRMMIPFREKLLWAGWDYGHLGDYNDYSKMLPSGLSIMFKGKKWTLAEIQEEVIDCIKQMEVLDK